MRLLATRLTAIASAARRLLFSPLSLFTTGVNGAWYDPSDITTLYRDAAGTLPVTAVEQPVGLILDKSKGLVLGSEVVGSGWVNASWDTFSTTGSSFTATKSTAGGTDLTYSTNTVLVSLGAWYEISLNVSSTNLSSYSVGLSNTTNLRSTPAGFSGTGLKKAYVYANTASGNFSICLFTAALGSISVDNISVRELPGNHAFNSSGNSANFPVLSARYNLLEKTEDLSNAYWTNNTIVTANTHTSPNGALSADTVTSNGTANNISRLTEAFSGVQYRLSVSLKYTNNRWVFLQLSDLGTTHRTRAWFDVLNGVKGTSTVTGSGVVVDYTITPEGDGWYRCTLVATNPITTLYAYFPSLVTADGVTTVAANGQSVAFWGADLRVANDALNQPAYQRVNTATDYDTVGFKPYLKFNGTNQWLQTNSIDFSYTDKMFVCAGVRKLSDGNFPVIVETYKAAASTFDSFGLHGSQSSTLTGYAAGITTTATSFWSGATGNRAAPITDVVSVTCNSKATTLANAIQLRINTSAQILTDISSAGIVTTNNFGSNPLFIGAREGSSLYFNGRLYQLVVAGKQASDAEITSTETYLNQKTGAY